MTEAAHTNGVLTEKTSAMNAPATQDPDSFTELDANGTADTLTDGRAESVRPAHTVGNKQNAADTSFLLPFCTYTGRKISHTCCGDVAGDGLEAAAATVLPWAVCETGPDSPAGC